MPTRIHSVKRSVEVVLAVAQLPARQRTASAVARLVNAPLPTVSHTLSTLVDSGLLAKDEARCYQIGPAATPLAEALHRQTEVPASLLCPLRSLAETTGESVYYSTWRLGRIAILASIEGTSAVHVSALVPGYADDAHARASGKLLLAYCAPEVVDAYLSYYPLRRVTTHTIVDPVTFGLELESIRGQQFAEERGELVEDVACVAVPVTYFGASVGAYTAAIPLHRFEHSRDAVLEALQSAACAVRASPPRNPIGASSGSAMHIRAGQPPKAYGRV
ncbi:MAG: IclR family transcriptional regulator [Candidatus Dormibacteria bacterium]